MILAYLLLTVVSFVILMLYVQSYTGMQGQEGRSIMRAIIFRMLAIGMWTLFLAIESLAMYDDAFKVCREEFELLNLPFVLAVVVSSIYFLYATVKKNQPKV